MREFELHDGNRTGKIRSNSIIISKNSSSSRSKHEKIKEELPVWLLVGDGLARRGNMCVLFRSLMKASIQAMKHYLPI